MPYTFSLYTLPLLAAALLSTFIAVFAWLRRATRGALALSFLALTITLWTVAYIFEIAGAGLDAKYFWGVSEYIGITLAPYSWMVFSIQYHGRTRLNSPGFLWAAAVVPLLTTGLALTTKYHGLLWSEYHVEQIGDFSALGVTHGPWFFVHLAYSYLLLLAGAVLIVQAVWRKQGLYRGQVVALLTGVLTPWLGNILYLTGNSPIPYLDLTPLAFTVTSVAVAWAMFGFRLVDVAPIARDLIVDGLRDGLIVLDMRGRIVDMNTAAARLIGLPADQAIGKPAEEVLEPWQALVERFRGALDSTEIVEVGTGEARRKLGLRVTALWDNRSNLVGRIVTFWETERARDEAPGAAFRIKEPDTQPRPIEPGAVWTPSNAGPAGRALRAFFAPPLIEVHSRLHPSSLWAQTIEQTFTVIMRILAALGTLALLLSLPSSWTNPAFLAALTALIGLLWFLGQARRLPFGMRVLLFMAGMYALTFRELAHFSFSPEAFALSLTFIAFGVLLAGARGGLASFAVMLITLLGFGVLIGGGWYLPSDVGPDRVIPESLALLAPRLAVFSVLAGGLGAAVHTLLNSLGRSQQREIQTNNLLHQERDLLEQRVIERTAQLAAARDQALEASNFKSQLLSRVSHELRTPLGGMLGFAELLEIDAYGPLNEEQHEAAANIIENANYLTDVVNDLLDEAQIEAGMILLDNTPFSPCDVLAEVKATIEVLTARKGLSLVCVCAPEVPATMDGDAKRFRQVLMNLAGNAVKFTREGEVRMQFFCPSPGELVIRVSDTGAGIPPEARGYIFSAFRQVDNRITRENRGSGLGLSISRQLVELMGGRIALESEVGRGSTFTISLPIRRGVEGIQ